MLEGVKTSPAIRALTGLPLTVKVMLSPTARPAAARKAELASTSCGPWYRLGQVAMEAVRASANGHAQPAVLPSRHQPLRHREGVGEWGQRCGQRWGHALALPTIGRSSACQCGPLSKEPGNIGEEPFCGLRRGG